MGTLDERITTLEQAMQSLSSDSQPDASPPIAPLPPVPDPEQARLEQVAAMPRQIEPPVVDDVVPPVVTP